MKEAAEASEEQQTVWQGAACEECEQHKRQAFKGRNASPRNDGVSRPVWNHLVVRGCSLLCQRLHYEAFIFWGSSLSWTGANT